MQLNPYLVFNGDCEQALKFYEQAIGGKIKILRTFAGSPAAEYAPPDWGSKILHAVIEIDGQQLMASDAPPGNYEKPQGLSVSIALDDRDKGERIFNALAEGGRVTMPLEKTFWSEAFGMLVDRFGVSWMVGLEH